MEVSQFNKLYHSVVNDIGNLIDFPKDWSEWSFKVSGRLTDVAGTANYFDKVLEFSKKYIEFYDEEEVRDTIIHEIAHAMTKGHNHDEVWRNLCLRLGGSGEEFYDDVDDEFLKSRYKYVLYCSHCKRYGRAYQRKRKEEWACKRCCVKYNQGKYSDDFAFIYKTVDEALRENPKNKLMIKKGKAYIFRIK